MTRGLYIAGTGMLVQRKKMDVLVNNIANAETTGYKSGELVSRSFNDMLLSHINDPAVLNRSVGVGPLGPGVHIDEVIVDFQQGPLEETQRQEDLAIEGRGFFVVATPNGERYTRDGGFFLSPMGYLVNCDGLPVMGDDGYIYAEGNISVDANGHVTSDSGYGGRLRIVDFAELDSLRKEGNNLYTNYGGSPMTEAENATVRQGYLEGSNIDLAKTMVDMIQITRAHEIGQRVIRMIDDTLGKAVNEVGRIR
mgnify:CR=1 FL=1